MLKAMAKWIVWAFLFSLLIGMEGTETCLSDQREAFYPGNRPLSFIPNMGQFPEQVAYCSKTDAYSLWIMKDGIIFDSPHNLRSPYDEQAGRMEPSSMKMRIEPIECNRQILHISFLGRNETLSIIPLGITNHHVNFFWGNTPSDWTTGIPTSQAVLYQNIYPHIDLKISGKENTNTYEFIVNPGGFVQDIEFKYEGFVKIMHPEKGSLRFEAGQCALHTRFLGGYFQSDEILQTADIRFRQTGDDSYGFDVDPYENGKALVIELEMAISPSSTHVESMDMGYKIAVDSEAGIYIAGRTKSMNFPITDSSQNSISGCDDVFITKLDSSNGDPIYSTYLGGISNEYGKGLFVDSQGFVYLTGITNSYDFPTSNALFEHSNGGLDAFVAKLNPTGSQLVYSTYLGGSSDESGQSLVVDSTGAACVVGWTESEDFPTHSAFKNRLSGRRDVFLTKIHPSGKSLVFSTYLGGGSLDFGKDISQGESETIWVTGYTSSSDFPVRDAIMPEKSGKLDAFLTQFDASGNGLIFSTFLGGSSNDIGNAISNEFKGSILLTGYTASENFPVKNAFNETLSGTADAFVIKLRIEDKSLIYSTFLGGDAEDSSCDIEVDSMGAAYITGYTSSKDFPLCNAYNESLSGECDAFVVKIDPNGSSLSFSTFLGGNSSDLGRSIALDRLNAVYVTGYTRFKDFPTQQDFSRFYTSRGYSINIILVGYFF